MACNSGDDSGEPAGHGGPRTEICNSGRGEDEDGWIDCSDDDCYRHIDCFNCFGETTPILTPNGEVSIESLQPGDQILGFDERTRRGVSQTVTHTKRRLRRGLGTLTLSHGRTLAVTANHPFHVQGGYLPASQLSVGQTLLGTSGDADVAPVGHHGFSRATDNRVSAVHDIAVADTHNYFAAGVLVHNKSPIYPDCTDPGYRSQHQAECDPQPAGSDGPRAERSCVTQADCPTGACSCAARVCQQFACVSDEQCSQEAWQYGSASPELALCVDGNCWFDRTFPWAAGDPSCDGADAGSDDSDGGA